MTAPPLDRRRFAVLAAVALLTNLFVAPASLFQNDYLEDIRGFSATTIAIFTLATATPAGIGLILGGRVADLSGRKRIIAAGLPAATAFGVLSYSVGGPMMWLSVFLVGVARRASPTRPSPCTAPSCSRPATAAAPPGCSPRRRSIGGIGGLLVMGTLLDRDWSHGSGDGPAAPAPRSLVVVIVLLLVPRDRPPGARGPQPRGSPARA